MRKLLPLLALVALLAAGCGGGSSSVTKEQFEAHLKAVCDEYSQRADKELGEAQGDPTSPTATPAEVRAFAHLLDQVTTLFGEQLRELRALEPPTSEQAQYAAFLRAYGETESALARAARAARRGDRAGMTRQLSVLDELGVRVDATGIQCG